MTALVLWNEINIDPLGRGYSGMTNEQIADDLNSAYRERNRARMAATEVLNAIQKTEYDSLNTTNKGIVWDLLSIGELNPFGIEASIFVDIFGGGSATITNLQALRKVSITRAEELGLPAVSPGLVAEAKGLGGA